MRRGIALAAATLGAAAIVATGCRIEIDGGETVTESVEVGAFDEIEVSSAFDVTVDVGDEPSLVFELDERALDNLEVEVDGDRLRIGLGGGLFSISGPLEARITTPSLSVIDLDGAVSLDVDGLEAERLEIDLDGASRVTGRGSVGVLVVDAEGASRVEFDDVAVERAEIEANGASRIELTDADEVSGRLAGASSVDVSGDATVDVQTSGASSIDRN